MALNVLVVDDSAVMRHMIIKTLGLCGIPLGEVHQAGNGKEGLEVLDRSWVDLILVDINMPIMNGEEMITKLRENPELRDTAVIVVSTDGSATRIEMMQKKGAGFVHKPFTPDCSGTPSFRPRGRAMSSWLETRLFRATARTFEDLGFMLPSSDLNDAQKRARPDAAVEIAFKGIFSGRLVLTVSGPILAVVAGNMLGEDESEMPREAQLDALGELANVICGNVLPEIAGDRETFALTPPVLLAEIPGSPAAWAGTVGEVRVGLDEGRAEVRLYLEGEVPMEARAEAA